MEVLTIDALAAAALDALRRSGASPKTLREYEKTGFAELRDRFGARGQVLYSRQLADMIVREARAERDAGTISRWRWSVIRRAGDVLALFARTGGIQDRHSSRWGLRQPTEGFAELLDGFCAAAAGLGWGEGTIKSSRSAVRQFVFALEDAGIVSARGLTPAVVGEAVTVVAGRYKVGLGSWLFAVRAFLRHLHRAGATGTDLSAAVPELPAVRRTVREGFTEEEVRLLLATASGDSPIDRRDLAIMTLASRTGLRAGDLARLRRGDIDWRAGEIRLVQAKTGTPVCLPLDAASGNAIAAWLLTDRAAGDSEFVFTRCAGPLRPLEARAISMIVTRRMRLCGIDAVSPRRGSHSFRRGLGTRLLEADTPIDTVRQVLGHSRVDSAKPYLSLGERGLRDCAISLATIGAGERQ